MIHYMRGQRLVVLELVAVGIGMRGHDAVQGGQKAAARGCWRLSQAKQGHTEYAPPEVNGRAVMRFLNGSVR
jgi:hypothetical protein